MRAQLSLSLALALLPVLGPRIALTQEAAPRPSPAPLIFEAAAHGPLRHAPAVGVTVDSIPRRIRPTHWKTGALIGGLSVGAGLAVLAAGVCSAGAEAETDCSGAPVAGALLGAVLGGFIGALIGGQFPKKEKSSDSGGGR